MSEKLGVRPLADRVIVKRLEERKTDGGIVIPDTVEGKSQRGIVLAIGPGTYKNGELIKVNLKCNDKVIFAKYAGTEIKIDGKNFLVMKEDDIIAVLD